MLWVLIATSLALPGPLVSLAVVQILNHPTFDWLVYLYDRTIVAPVLGGILIQRGMLTAWAWAAAILAGVGAVLSLERTKARPAWEEAGTPGMQA